MYDVKHETFNDGVLRYGYMEPVLNSFKKKLGEVFKDKGILFFKRLSSREADVIRCSSLGYSLDIKLKVPYRPNITTTDKVFIENINYDIIYLDEDNKRYIYLYLQKAGIKND